MTSLSNCLRLLQLRRRYAVVGLIICFTVCFFIYSAIPARHHDLEHMILHHSSDTKLAEEDTKGANVGVKGWPNHSDAKQPQHAHRVDPLQPAPEKEKLPSSVAKAAPAKHTNVAEKTPSHEDKAASGVKPAVALENAVKPHTIATKAPSPSSEARALKKKLGGVDVFSGNLGQVVSVPFAFNISSERTSRLEANTMFFKQLQQQVRDTRAYLISVQPDFDVNAGACRCGSSISTECACCAKLTMKRFLMERQACVNFTYVLKDHVLRVSLGYHRKRIAERTLAAATPPMLCAGQAVDLCAAFRNVTYKVQLDSVDHKTSLSGCLDLIMRLKTRPIAIYPMGCFRLGRDPKLVHIDKMNNWMP